MSTQSTQLTVAETGLEILNSEQLAERLNVSQTWVKKNSQRSYTSDPIPSFRLGRFVRYAWGSPNLTHWLERRIGQSTSTREPGLTRRTR